MKILSIDYTFEHKSLDIYLSGCKGNSGIHCDGCHNPTSWRFDLGHPFRDFYDKIEDYIKDNLLIKNIMIFGGEPLDQDINLLLEFIKYLKLFNKKIWIFTRFDYSEVDHKILDIVDYIKCGEYIPEKKTTDNVCYGITLATSNQIIYKLT